MSHPLVHTCCLTGRGLQQVGQELADVAPFGELKEHYSFKADGITYYVVR